MWFDPSLIGLRQARVVERVGLELLGVSPFDASAVLRTAHMVVFIRCISHQPQNYIQVSRLFNNQETRAPTPIWHLIKPTFRKEFDDASRILPITGDQTLFMLLAENSCVIIRLLCYVQTDADKWALSCKHMIHAAVVLGQFSLKTNCHISQANC